MSTATQSQDKVYKLLGKHVPLSFVLASRDTKRMRLMYFDKENKRNRTLRYATNMNSPFVDEQNGEVILEDIIFENGFLTVPETNPALQEFLKYHPGNGTTFKELNPVEDAEKELAAFNLEEKAILAINSLKIDQIEHLYRVITGQDASLVDSKILIRDVKLHARRNPAKVLEKLEDPALSMQSTIRLMFDRRVLTFKNNQRDVHFTMKDNHKRMISVAAGADPYREVQAHFETEEGFKDMQMLMDYMEEM